MRLGDLDDLKKKLQARHDNGDDEFDKGYNIGIESAFDLIDNAPTVENITVFKGCDNCELERPQGEWVANNYGEHHCNKCGHYALFEEDEDSGAYIERLSQHCPWCGAEMRKEEES